MRRSHPCNCLRSHNFLHYSPVRRCSCNSQSSPRFPRYPPCGMRRSQPCNRLQSHNCLHYSPVHRCSCISPSRGPVAPSHYYNMVVYSYRSRKADSHYYPLGSKGEVDLHTVLHYPSHSLYHYNIHIYNNILGPVYLLIHLWYKIQLI